MKESTVCYQNDDDEEEEEEEFHDAFDEFPFHDCTDTLEDAEKSSINCNTSPATSLRRRRSLSDRTCYSAGSTCPISSISCDDHPKFKERDMKFSPKINESESVSTITNEDDIRSDDLVGKITTLNENEDSNSNILLYLAGLVIKAIGFHMNFVFKFIIFPIRLIYTWYMFVVDPFGLKRRAKSYVVRTLMRIGGSLCVSVSRFVCEWLKEQKSIWKLGLKCGWGILWFFYVCVILLGLLVVAFALGGLAIKAAVEEPIKLKEPLNFDYAEKSPVAYATLMVCPGPDCGVERMENVQVGKIRRARVIPPNHKLQVTVAFKRPESNYNRNLGVFQLL